MIKLVFTLFLLLVNFSSYAQGSDEIFSKVFKTKERWVPVNIIFDSQDLGEIPVKFENNKAKSFLKTKSVLSALLKDSSLLTDDEVTNTELAKSGVELILNEEKFFLEAKIDIKYRKEIVTNLSSDYKPEWVKNESTPEDISFFSNFFFYAPYAHNKTTTDSELDLAPNLKLYDFVVESSHTYKEDFVARKFTRLVYDRPQDSTRLVLGDNSGPSKEFVAPIQFLGLSYGKNFSLRPYDVTVPRGYAEFELTEPSTVKVYVNGSLIQILRLREGKHNLEDLPLIQGLNEVKLVIETELGRIDEIIIPASFSQDLLKKGLSDFYYSIGKKSTLTQRDLDYSDDEEVYTVFHRYGFSNTFTLGGLLQGDDESQILGSDQVFSSEIGQFKFQQYASNSSSEYGGNLKGEYYYLNRSVKGEAATGHLVGLEWRSPKFKVVGDESALNYARTKLSYSFNSTISLLNFRIGTEYEWNKLNPDSLNANLGLSRTFKRRLNVNLTSSLKETFGHTSSFDISLFFNWYLAEEGHSIYGNYNSTGNNSQLSWQKLQTSSHDEFSYQVTARNDESGSSAEIDANYNHHRVETSLRHTQSKSNGTNWNQYDGRLKLGTAIAFAGNKFSVGRPITDGFAIISRDEITENQDIKINKSGLDYEYESDFFNSIMVSKLQAYRYRHLRIDSTALDDGLSLENEEYSLFPSYKSGIHINLKGKGSVSVVANLVLPNGKRAALKTFDIYDDRNKLVQRSFTNRKGRLVAEGLNSGVYSVRLNDGNRVYQGTIRINNKKFGLLNLEDIKLVRAAK
ncbi:fimbrial biogenesis outer membrane usher protein [Halobacteriovorax sp. HLS]|uniref:fimbrial biogenesis outer membrane usher protein n=1 Tax=Halobacteriovorax sp. HLS TaxID=2234000 RepID=UPI000FD71AA4|nr:fimbrial biogenesis outer membrane usher protein [Halobacteriovorax sp. HLS]